MNETTTQPDSHHQSQWNAFQWITRIISLMLLFPVVILVIFALTTPITITGLLYLLGTIAVVVGLVSMAWGYQKYRFVLWLGLGLIVAVIAVRVVVANRDSKIRLIMLPEQNSTCLISCIFDEQDVSLFSTRILALIGWLSPNEQDGLLNVMSSEYRALAEMQPITASPFIRTYLGQQRSGASDAVVIEPDDGQPATMGIIFLHGFTGNFTMPCWLVAQAVRAYHALTVCPSVGWDGYWWIPNGEDTLRETIDYLHQRGVSRIYLAGLSNGAVGASEMAYKLTDDISGLILISGASPDAQDSGLPVLVLAGSNDERMPADMLYAYAERMGSEATFFELDSDHFMLAKKAQDVQAEIASWLGQQPGVVSP